MAPLLLHIFHLERVQPKKIRTIAADYIFSLSIIWIEDGCCIWRESRCYTVALRSKKRPPWVILHGRGGAAAPWRIRTIVSRGTPTAIVKGNLFFFLPTRDCSAWGFYASTADIYPPARKLSAIVGLAVISQRKKKGNFQGKNEFFLCAAVQFSHHRPQLVRLSFIYEKRKWLRLFFYFGGNPKANNERHTADWIYQMMNATLSLDSLLDRVGNFAFRWVAQTPFVFFTYQILFLGFYLRGKNSNWTSFFNLAALSTDVGWQILYCSFVYYSWRSGWLWKFQPADTQGPFSGSEMDWPSIEDEARETIWPPTFTCHSLLSTCRTCYLSLLSDTRRICLRVKPQAQVVAVVVVIFIRRNYWHFNDCACLCM